MHKKGNKTNKKGDRSRKQNEKMLVKVDDMVQPGCSTNTLAEVLEESKTEEKNPLCRNSSSVIRQEGDSKRNKDGQSVVPGLEALRISERILCRDNKLRLRESIRNFVPKIAVDVDKPKTRSPEIGRPGGHKRRRFNNQVMWTEGIVEKSEEKQSESLHERVKPFMSKTDLIHGTRQFSPWNGSVVDSIVGVYLTQNSNDTISSTAFMSLAAKFQRGRTTICSSTSQPKIKRNERLEMDKIKWAWLKEKYSTGDDEKNCGTSDAADWDAVRMATVPEIADAIKFRGMEKNLAKRIKNCLNILVEFNSNTDIEWMHNLPGEEARELLKTLPGLGVKSIECICLLTLLKKAFPVDTNAGRVAVRLGWVPLEPLPEVQKFHLLKEYPEVDAIQMYLWERLSQLNHLELYELHCQMITFGKTFCTKKDPNCISCPMRAECLHYASALASSEGSHTHAQENDKHSRGFVLGDIEDFGIEGDDDKIRAHLNALGKEVTSVASLPVPKMKNLNHLRTEHIVCVLPDEHPLLDGFEKTQEGNDYSLPYLLAIWNPHSRSLDDVYNEGKVFGTIMIPARIAVRGMFPLNGTYFQANEVFADHASSEFPIQVSTELIRNLPTTTLYCGNRTSAICKGMKTFEARKYYRKEFVCFRGFDREKRIPKSLSQKFHHTE